MCEGGRLAPSTHIAHSFPFFIHLLHGPNETVKAHVSRGRGAPETLSLATLS